MKNSKKKSISVRLDTESAEIINQLAEQKVNISAYINDIIKLNTAVNSQLVDKRILLYISNMQTLLEYCDDEDFKSEMRKEINQLCHALK